MSSPSPVDSDPELINHSTADIADQQPSTGAEPEPEPEPATADAESFTRPPALTRQSTSALEKCWICLSTRDEDPPSPPNPPTEWRSPCSCSLQAHESCLLDWIADQEAPRSRGGRSPEKILCPQCRSEIKVQRPVDPVVNICRRLDRVYGRFVLPCLASALTGTVLSGCYMHGRLAVLLVFGEQESREIHYRALRQHNSGHLLAYTLIPLNLIFARTRYADFVLPSGTLFLVAHQLQDTVLSYSNGLTMVSIDWMKWPPEPSTAFALLHVTLQGYNWAYEKLFGDLNRRWIQEVQPRREEGYEGQEGNIANIMNEHEAELAEAGGDDGGVVLELELNLGAIGDDEELPQEIIDAARQEAAEAAPQEGQQQGGNAPANANDNGNGNNGGGRVHQLLGDNELMDDTSSIGQLVIGSLLMPAVASIAGNVLQMVLPRSWTSPSMFTRGQKPGLLASKWGRSLVGGLAFVVMKDMLVLYCRWRLAEGHKKRKIMNFDKSKKQYVPVR